MPFITNIKRLVRVIQFKKRAIALSSLLVLFVLLLFVWRGLVVAKTKQQPLIFTHVTVIDATGAPPQPDMTVVIVNKRIAALNKTGEVTIPKAGQVVNATGKFLIPGLWDMHVHHGIERAMRDIVFPLYIANGVTGVRDMFGDRQPPSPPNSVDLDGVNQWRQEIAAGTLLAPQIVASSAIVDGVKPVWPNSIAVANAIAGRQAVDSIKKRGADFVKVYSLLPRDAYFAIADEAKKQNIPFAGHVPFAVSAAEASDAGQQSIEHLTNILLTCSTHEQQLLQELSQVINLGRQAVLSVTIKQEKQLLNTYSDTKAKALFARFAKNNTWQVPTLTVLRSLAFLTDADFTNDERLKYMPAQAKTRWQLQKVFVSKVYTPEDLTNQKAVFQKNLEVVGKMKSAGVQILAGTDTGNPYIFPGFSLHDELALLVKAGLTPMEALQTATSNPAKYLGLSDSLGTVERGKVADLVLLEANPLEQISNTQKIAAVVVGGKLITKATLQKMLTDVEIAAKHI